MQPLNGGLGLGVVEHLNKAKASRTAGLPILEDLHTLDVAIRFEELPEVVFRGRQREIPDKDSPRALLLSWRVDVRCGGYRRSQGHPNDAEDHAQIEQERVDRDRGGLWSLPARALYPLRLGHPPSIVRVDEPSCGRN